MSYNDSLTDALKIINDKKIPQFPLFSNGKLQGNISDNGITNWLTTKIEVDPIILRHAKMSNVIDEASDDSFKNYKVIKPDVLLFDVLKIFSNKLKYGSNSFILLISDLNVIKLPEDILGIITPWDIPMIRAKMEV